MTEGNALETFLAWLGIGGPLAIVMLGIFFVLRNAVAVAVEQAAQVELERIKGKLAAEIEDRRQAFARDLERERQSAARDLEEFKAELGLAAEMRRQVAAQRVAALQKIAELGEPLVRQLTGHANDDESVAAVKAVADYMLTVRSLSHLFTGETYRHLQDRAANLNLYAQRFRDTRSLADLEMASSEREALLDLVRKELGIL